MFSSKSRKWDFAWRGVKISAKIEDPVFLADIKQRNRTVGNGDSLKCILLIKQKWQEEDGVWLNAEYVVKTVLDYIEAPKNRYMLDDKP